MKSCSLDCLISDTLNKDIYENYIRILTDNKKYNIKKHELKCIKNMIEALNLTSQGKSYFYYSFEIPQLGKEFDLIKMDKDTVINIELKSILNEEDIISQLQLNMHYLNFLPQKNKFLYAFCSQNSKFYKLNDYTLVEVNKEEIINNIENIISDENIKIEDFFKPVKFLVSPLNNTELFLEKKYLLTPQQLNIKKDILSLFKGTKKIAYIQSIAGTGKTLLLYDIAKDLANDYKVCIVHCGILCNGQIKINRKVPNLKIISAKDANTFNFSDYNIILIDECHRILEKTLINILSFINDKSINCIMVGDDNQKLSNSEEHRNLETILIENNIEISYKNTLTKKIRTNQELSNFIQLLFDKSKKKITNFYNVQVIYAENEEKLKTYINLYINLGYKYICYTPSLFVRTNLNDFDKNYLNTHKSIGQEFNNVIVYLDNNFYYTPSGKLKSKNHPNPDYIYDKLLLQALTRAREKIAIVVLENIELLNELLKIFD